ncbi:uncharacterized protein JN550_004445 [Neoarthrinium moseri]|uniref:uncharacterized protein n=1 Tax=Neoarthrinium moseri TaxID=1658444 RepID=UPI001FDAEB7D|nr:uncharacterized protein JN550_004445 [Neoarthrinium moseri]KAI1871451.1 hypothetical protein JN550_004445 [Neoarthrinium moseri]
MSSRRPSQSGQRRPTTPVPGHRRSLDVYGEDPVSPTQTNAPAQPVRVERRPSISSYQAVVEDVANQLDRFSMHPQSVPSHMSGALEPNTSRRGSRSQGHRPQLSDPFRSGTAELSRRNAIRRPSESRPAAPGQGAVAPLRLAGRSQSRGPQSSGNAAMMPRDPRRDAHNPASFRSRAADTGYPPVDIRGPHAPDRPLPSSRSHSRPRPPPLDLSRTRRGAQSHGVTVVRGPPSAGQDSRSNSQSGSVTRERSSRGTSGSRRPAHYTPETPTGPSDWQRLVQILDMLPEPSRSQATSAALQLMLPQRGPSEYVNVWDAFSELIEKSSLNEELKYNANFFAHRITMPADMPTGYRNATDALGSASSRSSSSATSGHVSPRYGPGSRPPTSSSRFREHLDSPTSSPGSPSDGPRGRRSRRPSLRGVVDAVGGMFRALSQSQTRGNSGTSSRRRESRDRTQSHHRHR